MYRIVRPDGSTEQSWWLRILWTLSYLALAGAGVALLIRMDLTTFYGVGNLWIAVFLVVGGLISMAGSIRRHWIGEFIGAPLLAAALAALGMELWITDFTAAPYAATANLLLLMSMSLAAGARWRISISVYRVIRGVADAEERPND